MTRVCPFFEISDKITLRILVLCHLLCLGIGVEVAIVVFVLAQSAHLFGKDARMLVLSRTALYDAVAVEISSTYFSRLLYGA